MALPQHFIQVERGNRCDHYQTIPTLTDYFFVAQDEERVMLYTRHDDHYHTVTSLENRICLSSVDVSIALADVFEFSQ